MTSRCAAALAACAASIAIPAGAQSPGSTYVLNSQEAMVAWSLHESNREQIETADLAASRAASPAVRSFADRLSDDHRSAEAQLQAYARSRGLDFDALERRVTGVSPRELELERRVRSVGSATGEWAFTWEHAVRARRTASPDLARLRGLQGADFDREFVRLEVAQHQVLTDRLAEARARTSDAELKNLVDAILPVCQQHLATAQRLQPASSTAQ